MANIFRDRQPTRPNRYRVVPETGNPYYVTLERADEPLVQGTALTAATLNSLVSTTGDTMKGYLRFEDFETSDDNYFIYTKLREISNQIFLVNAGCGTLGGKGIVCFEVREGSERTSPRLGRLEIGEQGVSFQDKNGKRTFLYSSGIAAASVG